MMSYPTPNLNPFKPLGVEMEAVLLFIALFAFFYYRSLKKDRKKLLKNLKTEVDQRLTELAPEQAAYEADMNSLPALAGNGRFDVDVDLRGGDAENFENYLLYLEATGNSKESVVTLLSLNKKAKLVEVYLGQAYMGKLGGPGHELYDFIEEHGGRMVCAGLMGKRKDRHTFRLDIYLPPKLEV